MRPRTRPRWPSPCPVSSPVKPSSPRALSFRWHEDTVTVTCPDLPYGGLVYEVQHRSTFDSQWQVSGRGVLGGGGAEGLATRGSPERAGLMRWEWPQDPGSSPVAVVRARRGGGTQDCVDVARKYSDAMALRGSRVCVSGRRGRPWHRRRASPGRPSLPTPVSPPQSKEEETCNVTVHGLDADKCYLLRARVRALESSYGSDTYPSDWSQVSHLQRAELRGNRGDARRPSSGGGAGRRGGPRCLLRRAIAKRFLCLFPSSGSLPHGRVFIRLLTQQQ